MLRDPADDPFVAPHAFVQERFSRAAMHNLEDQFIRERIEENDRARFDIEQRADPVKEELEHLVEIERAVDRPHNLIGDNHFAGARPHLREQARIFDDDTDLVRNRVEELLMTEVEAVRLIALNGHDADEAVLHDQWHAQPRARRRTDGAGLHWEVLAILNIADEERLFVLDDPAAQSTKVLDGLRNLGRHRSLIHEEFKAQLALRFGIERDEKSIGIHRAMDALIDPAENLVQVERRGDRYTDVAKDFEFKVRTHS